MIIKNERKREKHTDGKPPPHPPAHRNTFPKKLLLREITDVEDADEVDGEGAEGEDEDAGRAEKGRLFELNMPVDPNEPRYCICHEVSHGQMVCCDNPACPIAWFHFGCVGLTQAPPANSKWYCPSCRAAMNKKK